MSAASEATLQELLQVNREMAGAISKLASAGGGSGGGGGGGAAGKASGALGKTFETLGKGAGMITGIFGTLMKPALMAASAGFGLLSSSAKTLAQNQLSLADGAIAGTNSLASLTAGLEQLPGILGFAMKAYNFQIKKMEATIKTYDEISQTGARFGGSLDEVRSSARGMGLGLDEFAGVMKNAGPQLRFMGDTVEDGAKGMIAFNKQFVMGKDGLGKGLLGMGYSLQEANNMLADYSAVMGGLRADQLKDQKGMEQSVRTFAEELDASAQLEGKTRQQKMDEMKEQSQNAAVEAEKSKLSADQVAKFELAMMNARTKGEKEYLQAQLLGLPPMTKAAQQFAAMNGEGAAALDASMAKVRDNTKLEEAKGAILDNANKSTVATAKVYDNLGVAGKAAAFGNNSLSESAKDMAKVNADLKKQNITSEEDLAKKRSEIGANQKKAADSAIADQKQAQGKAKYAGEDLMDALYKAFKPLIDIVLDLNQMFIQALPAIGAFVGDVVKGGMGVLTSIFKAIDWTAVKTSFMGAWKMLTETFGNIYDAVTKAMGGGGGIGEFLQTGMTKFFEVIKGVVEAVGIIVVKFASSGLFQSLKQFMLNMWDLIGVLVDAVVAIVKSPVGEFVIDVIFGTFEILFNIVNDLIKATIGAVKFIADVFKFMSQDFATAWQKIKEWAGKIVDSVIDWFKSIPKKITDFFGEGNLLDKVFEALKGIIGSVVDGIKSIGTGIINFFKSSDAQKPTAPTTSANPAAPSSPNQPLTEDAKKRAEEQAKTTVTANPNNSSTPTVTPKSNNPQDVLIAELQTLNKATAEMLRAIRDTSDYTKSTANILASNGNLFRRS